MSDIVLSILIITYNQEKYIKQTLDSILNQNYNFTYEIIIGDDSSNDDTRNILHYYSEKYPNIIKTIYNERNLGVIKNYFNVLNHCTGKYVMECAGDDYWLPGKVEKQIDLMEKDSSIGLCYGKAKCFDENGKYLNYSVGNEWCTFTELLKTNCIPACTVCFRKSVFESYLNEINPEKRTWKMEDYPAWLWMSKNTRIYFINDYLSAYRVLSESVSRTKDIDKMISFEENTCQIRNFFAEKYNMPVIIFDKDKYRQSLLFNELLNFYNKDIASELKKHLNLNSMKNIFKYIIFSSKFLFNFYYKLIKRESKRI